MYIGLRKLNAPPGDMYSQICSERVPLARVELFLWIIYIALRRLRGAYGFANMSVGNAIRAWGFFMDNMYRSAPLATSGA